MQTLKWWLIFGLAALFIIAATVIFLANKSAETEIALAESETKKQVFVLEGNQKVFYNTRDSLTGVYKDDLGSKLLDNQKSERKDYWEYNRNANDNDTKVKIASLSNSYKPSSVKKIIYEKSSPQYPPQYPQYPPQDNTILEKSYNYTDKKVGEVQENLNGFKEETRENFRNTNEKIDGVKDAIERNRWSNNPPPQNNSSDPPPNNDPQNIYK